MLEREHRTERIVAVGIAVVVVEVKGTCVAVIVIAPTIEERVARVRKVGVRLQFNPNFSNFLFGCLRTPPKFFLKRSILPLFCHIAYFNELPRKRARGPSLHKVLQNRNYSTERTVADRTTVVAAENKHACVGRSAAAAATKEHWDVRIHEARIIAIPCGIR